MPSFVPVVVKMSARNLLVVLKQVTEAIIYVQARSHHIVFHFSPFWRVCFIVDNGDDGDWRAGSNTATFFSHLDSQLSFHVRAPDHNDVNP